MNSKRPSAGPVFVVGVLLGAVLGSWTQRALMHRFMRRGPDTARIVGHLSRALALDEAQKAQATAIVEAHAPEVQALKKETKDKFDAIREKTDEEIRKILRPDQAPKLDAMIARWKRRNQDRDAPPLDP